MTHRVREKARNEHQTTLRSTDVKAIHPRPVRDRNVCQQRAQASQAEDDHQHTHDMNISADQLNLPPSQPIPEADRDKRPAKSKNAALRASEINVDLLEPNIIVGKRERKPYNPHTMTVDTSNIPMVPFHFSFAVAWDPGDFLKMIEKYHPMLVNVARFINN
jgi:hypothetical protein